MSKANNTPISPDEEIRARFRDFVSSLPQSGFKQEDAKTGYMAPVKRQLTQSEQQRFYNSLPSSLKEFIDTQRASRFTPMEEGEYQETEQEEEDSLVTSDEDDESIVEDGEREMTSDLVAYETFLHLDMTMIPQKVIESLPEDVVAALQASPSYRARERTFDKPKKKRGKASKAVFQTPMMKELAKRRLWRSLRQKKQEELYRQKSFVTVEVIKIVYIERNP